MLAALKSPAGLTPTVHMIVSSVVFGAAALLSYRGLLRGPEPGPEGPEASGGVAAAAAEGTDARAVTSPTGSLPTAEASGASASTARPSASFVLRWGTLLALVVIAASGGIVEDAGSSWAAIYLTGSFGATAFVASLGFITLQGMQFVGRLLGDGLVDRFGQRAVARTGGAVVLVGTGAALGWPTTAGTVVGLGLAGFGVATLIPAAMHAADQLPGFAPGSGLTIVTWLLRLGFLLSPPVVGAVADASSLRVGLLVLPLSGLLVVVFAQVLSTRRNVSAGAADARPDAAG